MSRVNLTLYHVVEIMWFDSGSATCHYWIWKSLNIVLVFVILSQFGPKFLKTESISFPCHVSIWHCATVAETMWFDSDSVTCHYWIWKVSM